MIEYVAYLILSGETDRGGKERNLGTIPAATVHLMVDGRESTEAACASNSLEAVLKAFCRATGIEVEMKAYQTRERFRNGNPLGKASVRITINGKEGKGYGRDTDSRKAFLLALIEATNQIQEEVENGASR